jgi:uncharacterized protein DUF4129
MSFLDLAGAPVPLEGVEVPLVPAGATLVGGILLVVFALQALRGGLRSPRPRRPTATIPAPAPLTPPPTPAPAAPQYKRAPVVVHFPQIKPDFPDTWGLNEPFDIVLKVEDRAYHEQRQIPGLTLTIDGETVQPVFTRGTAGIRRVFKRPGEKPITIEMRLGGEVQPRRTVRPLKVVEYRAEIADVFASFREEAAKTITPIREDATPWEIFDLLTSASPKIPGNTLREIISSFEEAKYSNHPVTRATYERMINALLEIERVEL